MLSPIIRTKVKGKTCRAEVSRSASSYCTFAPLPLSPMIANRTESSARGGVTGAPAPAPADNTSSSHDRASRCMPSGLASYGRGNDVSYQVDDQVRVTVEQHEMTREKAVFHTLRQRMQAPQQPRRDRRPW